MKLPQRWASLAREAVSPADSDDRDRFAFVMLLAFILVAPWLGSARLPAAIAGAPTPVGRLLIPAFGFAIGAVAFSSRSSSRSFRPLALPLGAILGIGLLGILQLVPLPDAALAQVAPVNLQIYHETAELLSLYGRTAPAPRLSLAADETAATVLRLGGYAALLLASAHLLRTRRRRRVFTGTVVAAACLQIVAAAALFASGEPFRGVAFGSAADFSDYLLILLPVGFGAFWAEILTNADRGRQTADRGDRLALRLSPLVVRGLACATIAVGIALTASPVNLAAGVVTIVILLLLAARRGARVRRAAAAAALGLSAAPLFVARANALPLSVLTEADAARNLAIWQGCLDAWQRFPIFGAGLGAFRDAFRRTQPRELAGLIDTAQSDPLQILVTGGAVGGLLALVGFGALLVVLLRRWRTQRHREERSLTLAGIGALLALGLDGLVEFNLGTTAVPATLACVIGLALAAGDGSAREQPPPPRPQ